MGWRTIVTRSAARVLAVIVALAAGATVAIAADQSGTFTEQARIAPTDQSTIAGSSAFGTDDAISADGTTAIVSDLDPGGLGAAWIYTRSGSSWEEQATLVPTTPADLDGGSLGVITLDGRVALSADGDTAVLGATSVSGPDSTVALLLVYTRSGSVWTLQHRIFLPQGVGGDSVSADGDTILVAGNTSTLVPGSSPATYDQPLSAFIYSRSDGSWTQTQLPAMGLTSCCIAMALSGDGNTAVIGNWNVPEVTIPPSNDLPVDPGVMEVFVRDGASWTEQQTLSVPADAVGQMNSQIARRCHSTETRLRSAARQTAPSARHGSTRGPGRRGRKSRRSSPAMSLRATNPGTRIVSGTASRSQEMGTRC